MTSSYSAGEEEIVFKVQESSLQEAGDTGVLFTTKARDDGGITLVEAQFGRHG